MNALKSSYVQQINVSDVIEKINKEMAENRNWSKSQRSLKLQPIIEDKGLKWNEKDPQICTLEIDHPSLDTE